MHFAPDIQTENRSILTALCVAVSAKMFTWMRMMLSSVVTAVSRPEAHGITMNAFKEEAMKKSTAYKMAQLSVLGDSSLDSESKLFILSLLMDDENLAKFQEREVNEE
jgi:hypothetical protein